MGPQASKSYPGRWLVRPAGPRAERARQEIDYGRRDVAGYVFGAMQPVTEAAFTVTYDAAAPPRTGSISWARWSAGSGPWPSGGEHTIDVLHRLRAEWPDRKLILV